MAVVATRASAVRKWVSIYRDGFGLQPIPSDPTPASEGGRKKPLVRYSHLWTERAPDDLFARFDPCNIQVMTGVYWGLCVLDFDGADAVAHADASWPRLPRTWVSWHSQGGKNSRHHWFRVPRGITDLRKRVVWRVWDDEAGDWRKHTAVELLCDGSLITAPPSRHIKTGRVYGFERGCSPLDCPMATLPDWVLRLPPVEAPESAAPEIELAPAVVQPRASAGRRYDSRQVVDALTDKAGIAAGWGLRIAGRRPSPDGWVPCHDFGRRDDNPSASFNVESGRFWRPGMGPRQTLSLFDLGAALGHFQDWQACRDSLAEYYGLCDRGK